MQQKRSAAFWARWAGARIAELRAARDLSLRALARHAVLPHTNLLRIERGEMNVPIETLGRIVAALGVTMEAFFADELFTSAALSTQDDAAIRLQVLHAELRELLTHQHALIDEAWAVVGIAVQHPRDATPPALGHARRFQAAG